MSMTNTIQFDADDIETATGTGLISTLDRDLDIKVAPFEATNQKAPTHRVYAKSPRGHDIEVEGQGSAMTHAARIPREMSAQDIIRGLAREYGITAERTAMDTWADEIARLSDADVPADDIADLVVTLKRRGILSADRASALYADYLSSGATIG